ncbi:hypothetical protein T492DRAFT_1076902 [Pavlovales sp. CCMP2436]|nr:hypothetical protein T492DRAFT_1076902 [Pavlovales sp. CCMP2436]
MATSALWAEKKEPTPTPKRKAAAAPKRKAVPTAKLDPEAYFRYLQQGQDRTELDTSPPKYVDDPEAGGGGKVEVAERVPLTKSQETAELIAAAQSKGFLMDSEELRWYLIQCTPGFERAIGRGLHVKAEFAGYGKDITEARVPLRRTLVYQKRANGYVPKEEVLMAGYVMVKMRMRRNLYNFIRDCESVLGFCGYDFGARNLAGGLKAGRGFIRPKPLSNAEVARIERQEAEPPSAPEDDFTIPAAAKAAALEGIEREAQGLSFALPQDGDAPAQEEDLPPLLPVLALSFRVGDGVRVLKGPFKNMEGPVLKINTAKPSRGSGSEEEAAAAQSGAGVLVTVELTLMGQATVVELDARAIASIVE